VKRKLYVIIAAAVILIGVGLTVWHYWGSISPPPKDMSGYVQVDATIESVFSSGSGTHLSTLLTVDYTYEGKDYTDTLRIVGYVEGQFKKGDTIKRYLDPANPGTLIEG